MDEINKQIKDVESYTNKLSEGIDDIENWVSALDDADAAKEMEKRFASHRHNCEEAIRLFEGLKDEIEELEMTEERVWDWLADNPESFTEIEVPEEVCSALWRDRIIDVNTTETLTLGDLFELLLGTS